MFYMSETLKDCGYKSRRAERLKSETLPKARKEAVEKQFFEGTVIYIGTGINTDGVLTNAVCSFRDGKWRKENEV